MIDAAPDIDSKEKTFPPPSPQWVSLARDRWVRYPVGDGGLRRPQELLATPARVRMPCMLIYGVSGAGKTMLSAIMLSPLRSEAAAEQSFPQNSLPFRCCEVCMRKLSAH